MKKTGICLLIAFIGFCGSKARAQSLDEDQTWVVGVGLDGGVVNGDYKSLYNWGLGINLRIGYQAGPGFITLSTGGIILPPNSNASSSLKLSVLAPFKLGYKAVIADNFFLTGEAGFALLRSVVDDAYGIATVNEGGFIYSPGLGVQFGRVELGLHYQATTIKGSSLNMPMARLGINF